MTNNDVLCAGVCPKMRKVAPVKKTNEKRKKLVCVKLASCPDHPRRHSPLKFCMRGRIREIVIYFKFHENRSRGLEAVWVENRPLPLTRPMAYTTARTTVQAVIQYRVRVGLLSANFILTRFRCHSIFNLSAPSSRAHN